MHPNDAIEGGTARRNVTLCRGRHALAPILYLGPSPILKGAIALLYEPRLRSYGAITAFVRQLFC
eukprot:scaffold14019_cov57-Cyclotella_meneghiniana.AAC.4